MATGTSYRTPGTLPPQTSGFVGREAELTSGAPNSLDTQLPEMLGEHRLPLAVP
jgi:hypothetical protein